MNLQNLQSQLKTKEELERKYASVAPNWPDHKKVIQDIANLKSQISKIESTPEPEPLSPVNLSNKIVGDSNKRINDLNRFYENSQNATAINKAWSFRFGAWWSGKWVSLWVEKSNLNKLNEDISTQLSQQEVQKQNALAQLEQSTNSQLANLSQLDANIKNQEEANRIAKEWQDKTYELNKAQQEEAKRQFDISAGVNKSSTVSPSKASALKSYANKSKPKVDLKALEQVWAWIASGAAYDIMIDKAWYKQSWSDSSSLNGKSYTKNWATYIINKEWELVLKK